MIILNTYHRNGVDRYNRVNLKVTHQFHDFYDHRAHACNVHHHESVSNALSRYNYRRAMTHKSVFRLFSLVSPR